MNSPILRNDKVRRRLTQVFAYLVGGNVYFYSGYAMFSLLYGLLHWRWWQAKILADTTGLICNYLVQRYWAFSSGHLRHIEGQTRRRYVTISVINLIMDYGIIGGLLHLGISPFLGMYISSGFFTVWNYTWYRWWVFPEDKSQV